MTTDNAPQTRAGDADPIEAAIDAADRLALSGLDFAKNFVSVAPAADTVAMAAAHMQAAATVYAVDTLCKAIRGSAHETS